MGVETLSKLTLKDIQIPSAKQGEGWRRFAGALEDGLKYPAMGKTMFMVTEEGISRENLSFFSKKGGCLSFA